MKAEGQNILLEVIQQNGRTLSYAVQIQKLSQAGFLHTDILQQIISEPKASQKEKISFRMDDIRKFSPVEYGAVKIQGTIVKLTRRKGTMMIEQTLLYTKEQGIYIGPTKNGQPRAVCIAPESIAVLKRWKTKQLELKIKCGPAWTENGFVFTKDEGTFMHPDSITDWLRKFS